MSLKTPKYQIIAIILLAILLPITSQGQITTSTKIDNKLGGNQSKATNNTKTRLYLIIGQSNAAGRDTNFDPNNLDLPSPNINILDDNGDFIEAELPLNQFSTIGKKLDLQGVNLGLEFAKEIHNITAVSYTHLTLPTICSV